MTEEEKKKDFYSSSIRLGYDDLDWGVIIVIILMRVMIICDVGGDDQEDH